MLSYRHAFHAGNYADVLKHFILVQLLDYLGQKDKPFWYIDTHAGAGMYDLDSKYAQKTAEYRDGIARLWQAEHLPAPLAPYLHLLRELNPDGLKRYPGSPWFAQQLLREPDRLRLFEMHSTDSVLLSDTFKTMGRRALVQAADGFAGLKSLLPPPPRRALVLIDPSYEEKKDYQRVTVALNEALDRFATGVYAVWYPLLQRPEARQFPDKLKKLPCDSWLNVSLTVREPAVDGFGMHGTGMFILNPPWTLAGMLREVMPTLTRLLAQDGTASFRIESKEN